MAFLAVQFPAAHDPLRRVLFNRRSIARWPVKENPPYQTSFGNWPPAARSGASTPRDDPRWGHLVSNERYDDAEVDAGIPRAALLVVAGALRGGYSGRRVSPIRSTRCAREGAGSNRSAKYCVSLATSPSRNSMMLTA